MKGLRLAKIHVGAHHMSMHKTLQWYNDRSMQRNLRHHNATASLNWLKMIEKDFA